MTRALAVALCLAAVPALAFEGVIETKMTMNRGKMDGAPEGTPSSFSGTPATPSFRSAPHQPD